MTAPLAWTRDLRRPVLWLALACHAVLSACYLFGTPAFEAPDESDHYWYAFHIAQTSELPLCRGYAARQVGRSPLDEATLAVHPPLYYGLLAGTMRVAGHRDTTASILDHEGFARGGPGTYLMYRHGADESAPVSAGMRLLFLLRGWSLLFGLLTVLLTHRLGRLAFPGRPALADGAALVVACLPMFSFMHGVLNAGNLLATWSHGVLVTLATALAGGALASCRLRLGIVLGTLLGLAWLTKLSAASMVGLVALFYVFTWVREPDTRRRTLASAALAALCFALVAGFVLLRNWQIYGDPLALGVHADVFAAARVPEGRTLDWLLEGFLPQIFTSLLGRFGWFTLPPPPWLVWVGILVAGAAVVGLLLRLLLSTRNVSATPAGGRAEQSGRAPVLWLLALALLLCFAAALQFNTGFRQPQGRLLFPAIGPFAILLCWGLFSLADRVPAAQRCLSWLAICVPPVIGATVFQLHFAPAFAPELAPAPPAHVSLVTGLTAVPLEPQIELVAPPDGARLTAPPVLTWQPQTAVTGSERYTVHVFTDQGRVLLATQAFMHLQLTAHEFAMPAGFWAAVPIGVPIHWKVRRVPDPSLGAAAADLPASLSRSFVRIE